MKVLLIQNNPIESPGAVIDLLQEKNIQYDLIDLDKSEAFPNPKEYQAVFIFGGPDSANDTNAKVRNELEKIREIVTAEIPYLGFCLGLQTLVKAHGGKVLKNKIKEIGFRDPEGNFFQIDLTDTGKLDALFDGIHSPFHSFQLHGETVQLTPDMELLATGKFCRIQAAKIGKNAYGLQFHPEVNHAWFQKLVKEDPDLQKMDINILQSNYNKIKIEYEEIGKQIITNFFKIAKLL